MLSKHLDWPACPETDIKSIKKFTSSKYKIQLNFFRSLDVRSIMSWEVSSCCHLLPGDFPRLHLQSSLDLHKVKTSGAWYSVFWMAASPHGAVCQRKHPGLNPWILKKGLKFCRYCFILKWGPRSLLPSYRQLVNITVSTNWALVFTYPAWARVWLNQMALLSKQQSMRKQKAWFSQVFQAHMNSPLERVSLNPCDVVCPLLLFNKYCVIVRDIYKSCCLEARGTLNPK